MVKSKKSENKFQAKKNTYTVGKSFIGREGPVVTTFVVQVAL